jgi:hypothetical protein
VLLAYKVSGLYGHVVLFLKKQKKGAGGCRTPIVHPMATRHVARGPGGNVPCSLHNFPKSIHEARRLEQMLVTTKCFLFFHNRDTIDSVTRESISKKKSY